MEEKPAHHDLALQDGAVVRASPRRRRKPGVRRWLVRTVVLAIHVALGIGALVSSSPRWKGAFLAVLVLAVLSTLIAWLSRASSRLSSSGREMDDYWRTRLGERYPSPR